jgi:glutamyl/glutaminyl-tRNA synthetase
VVDDAAAGVTRIVRGRDIAPSTGTHLLIQDLLGMPRPVYRHHLLLLEDRGEKLAKLHGSVGGRELRDSYSAEALVGVLAQASGLAASPEPRTASSLVAEFAWERVRTDDVQVAWTGSELRLHLQ